MRYFIFFLFVICSQTSLAQYTFKTSSNLIELESIDVETYSSRNGSYHSKIYKTKSGDTLTIEPIIALTVKQANTIDKIIKQFNGKLSFSEKVGNVYYLECKSQNSDEVLNITSLICKNGDVIKCDAVHYSNFKYSNTLYPKQYYLHNTSNNDIGINCELAWNIASSLGKGITVAVIDEGVDHNHEDLANVLDGYTVGYTNEKGDPINPTILNPKAHGVACAGIIGAANNSIGIRGIASNALILPVNISPQSEFSNDKDIASAIRWASERADILSCSWGGNGTSSTSISEAISDALKNGRNGKGCILVFSTGNKAFEYNGLGFPASEKGVISVGAVDRSGQIWYYSQRGTGICLVAPSGDGQGSSGDIVTTDRMGSLGYNSFGNYNEHFNGTSAACPQVSGVAALMLSVNPNLTATEVKNILQNTATDLGPTGYDTTYGSGLLNAYKAVCQALPLSMSGGNAVQNTGTYKIQNLPSNATVTWSIPAADAGKVSITTSGEGNKECTISLTGNKTITTTLTAVVTYNNQIIKTLSKVIGVLGTFSGTYSVPASTVNGVSFPAIVNRPFGASSYLEARSGSTITAVSEDFRYYTASWTGPFIANWNYQGNTLRFTLPSNVTSSTRMYINFKAHSGSGIARLQISIIQPPYALNLAQDGGVLNVNILKEDVQDKELSADETFTELATLETTNPIWTIEVINATTGIKKATVTTHAESYQFNTHTWPNGVYIVRASNGNITLSEKIVVK